MRLRPRARDNGRPVVCTADNGLDQPVTGEATLDVTRKFAVLVVGGGGRSGVAAEEEEVHEKE